MINGKAFIYLLVTLLIGFALGLFSAGLRQVKRDHKEERMRPRMVIGELLIRDLHLTEDQIDQVSGILDAYEKKADQRREMIQQQIQSDLDSLRNELAPYLNSTQLDRLDEWIEGGPPPGPGPQPGNSAPGMAPVEPGPQPPGYGPRPGEQGPPPPGRQGPPPSGRQGPPPSGKQGQPPPGQDSARQSDR